MHRFLSSFVYGSVLAIRSMFNIFGVALFSKIFFSKPSKKEGELSQKVILCGLATPFMLLSAFIVYLLTSTIVNVYIKFLFVLTFIILLVRVSKKKLQ